MNDNNFTEINEDSIALDELKKVLDRDNNLAKVSSELTLEELEQVLGSSAAMYGPPILPIFPE